MVGDSVSINGRPSRYDTIQSRRVIGHPNSDMGVNRPRSQYGAAPYRRFQDSSFSSFSDSNSMTRRPSIDTISTYLSHETPSYRYGYASQNGSFYSGSVGSQARILHKRNVIRTEGAHLIFLLHILTTSSILTIIP